jgi:PTH1 family peptidyl-tRNA hydrolase
MPDTAAPGPASSGSAVTGIRILAGLGNPGREYDGTRHNVGFAVLDRVASLMGVSFTKGAKWEALIAKVPGSDLVLLKPTTFMNLSGESVCDYARFHRIAASSTLVIADDVALPLGALRIRREGGSGGQKGLESILIHFATEKVPRLRIGIGAASPQTDLSGYVLSRFRPEEQSSVEETLSRAAEAALCAARHGLSDAMNLYNGAPSSDKSSNNTANQP